jgi:hypothetical protein
MRARRALHQIAVFLVSFELTSKKDAADAQEYATLGSNKGTWMLVDTSPVISMSYCNRSPSRQFPVDNMQHVYPQRNTLRHQRRVSVIFGIRIAAIEVPAVTALSRLDF